MSQTIQPTTSYNAPANPRLEHQNSMRQTDPNPMYTNRSNYPERVFKSCTPLTWTVPILINTWFYLWRLFCFSVAILWRNYTRNCVYIWTDILTFRRKRDLELILYVIIWPLKANCFLFQTNGKPCGVERNQEKKSSKYQFDLVLSSFQTHQEVSQHIYSVLL